MKLGYRIVRSYRLLYGVDYQYMLGTWSPHAKVTIVIVHRLPSPNSITTPLSHRLISIFLFLLAVLVTTFTCDISTARYSC